MMDLVLRDIQNKYEGHLKVWNVERIQMELLIINTLFEKAPNLEEVEWYSLCYNYLEEELIRRGGRI